VIPKARRHGLRLLVTPDTVLRWHRDIVRRRWAARSIPGKTGRPATRRNIRALALRLARENPNWGYRRIHGELAGLGVKIAASTVREILKNAGIDPTPRRADLTWPQFLRSQAEAILACDFFTADLLDGTQAYVLAVIEHSDRMHRSDRSYTGRAAWRAATGPARHIRRRAVPVVDTPVRGCVSVTVAAGDLFVIEIPWLAARTLPASPAWLAARTWRARWRWLAARIRLGKPAGHKLAGARR
jgi:transposase